MKLTKDAEARLRDLARLTKEGEATRVHKEDLDAVLAEVDMLRELLQPKGEK